MILKELASLFLSDMRVQIFDFSLVDVESDNNDWFENKKHIPYFGDYSEIPVYLFSRKIRCISVSDEYVNCLDIELKNGRESNERI